MCRSVFVVLVAVVMVVAMVAVHDCLKPTKHSSNKMKKSVGSSEESDARVFARRISGMDDDDDDDGGDDDEEEDGDDDDGVVKVKHFKESACRGLYCRTGRTCRVNSDGRARCVCGGTDFCLGHNSPVCGSDGKMYTSHCELHRVSCHEGSKLGVDHSGKMCQSSLGPAHGINTTVTATTTTTTTTTVAGGNTSSNTGGNAGGATGGGTGGNGSNVANADRFGVDALVERAKAAATTAITPASKVVAAPTVAVTTGQQLKSKEMILGAPTTAIHHPAFNTKNPITTHPATTTTTTSPSPISKSKKVKVVTSPVSEDGGDRCSHQNYKQFKTNLIHYQCARTGNNGCMADHQKKILAVTGMFDFYDRDMNKLLTPSELDQVEHKDHIDRLSRFCHLRHIFVFDDADDDEIVNIDEFYRAFGVKDSSAVDGNVPTTYTTLVSVGNAVELKCNIFGSKSIVWKRKGRTIESSDDIKIFEDNSLYIGDLKLHHMGNYSCHDGTRDEIFHIIIVQMTPKVKIHPPTQTHLTGSTASIRCEVEGVPQPEVLWSKDDVPLFQQDGDQKDHYALLNSNTTLRLKSSANFSESGLYTCTAKNSVGSESATASVVFVDDFSNEIKMADANSEETRQLERFAVFHESGYTIYELTNCHIEHHVFAGFELSTVQKNHIHVDPLKTLCPTNELCNWGGSVLARESLLYVSQPKLKRVLVIEVVDRLNPVEVIETDLHPLKLTYVPHLDQIWMTTCNKTIAKLTDVNVEECDEIVVKIIQQASKGVRHQVAHMKNVEPPHFVVEKLFLPYQKEALNDAFNQGYATIKSDLGYLHVVDLNAMRFVDKINLTEQKCVPRGVGYIPIGGYLFVSCKQFQESTGTNFHLVIDYITHEVYKKSDVGGGDVYVSPDSRHVVVLEEDGSIISVYKLTADGRLNHLFDEYTQLHLNHMSFYRAESGVGYNVYATSYVQNTILHLELLTGKVTMIEGAEGTFTPEDIVWNRRFRKIERGGAFFEHLMTSSRSSITGLDGQRKHIQCHWQNVNGTKAMTALPLVVDNVGMVGA